jgi:nitrite reductase/ring-hydroxylating ferredoxin subunit
MTLMESRALPRALSAREPGEIDIATTRPGTPGGLFMRQFWHAVCRSQDLPASHAKPIRIMSEDYALYRGQSGAPQVVAYRCPHRGAPLHLGWIEDDAIRCVYHGWKFDQSGQCVHQPAEEPGFARKVNLRTGICLFRPRRTAAVPAFSSSPVRRFDSGLERRARALQLPAEF